MGYKVKKIYQGSNLVRPDTGWKPGANTLAYYPLTSTDTVNDLSGNGYNLTNSNVTFGTYAGVSCASFNGSNGKLTASITTIPQGSNPRTTSVWIYYSGAAGKSIMGYGANRTRYGCWEMRYGGGSGEGYMFSAYYIDENTAVQTMNTWLLFTVTYDGSIIKQYINGELKKTSTAYTLATSGTNFEIGDPYSTSYFQGYASNAIIENKARTAQEITDYYNLTKSNYGTSESQPSSCFLAGTPVLVEGGSKPIDELNIGDVVLSYNKSTGEKEYNKVVDIIEHTETKDLLYTLNIEGQRIEATEFHKFYMSDNKEDWRWEEIRNLKEGQFIFSIGGAKKINSVEFKKFDGPCYNITVDNNHNYFVYDGILVHNAVSAS